MPYLDIRLSGPCLPDNIEKLAACMPDVIVREVPADAWGYQGVTQQARRLRHAMGNAA